MDFFKTKSAKIKSIQEKLKQEDLSLKDRLILMFKLMMLGLGKTEE